MEREIAKGLLSIGAVFLRPEQPFTWASGIKSPIYCDNRLILTAPEVRKKVEAAIAETVKAKFPACEVLMGTSTAGIAHAAIAATILDLPMGYVRSGSKEVLILTVLIWVISSAIFSAIYLAAAAEVDVPIMVR